MKTAAFLAITLTSLACCAGFASAANVAFNSGTATYDQGGNYGVGAAANGSVVDGFGWGIFSAVAGVGQTAASQTGIFTAAAPFSGSNVQISIPQYLGGDHYAKDFRVSYTTDAVPSAGGSWTTFPASLARAANGVSLTSLAGSRYGTGGVADGGITNFVLRGSGVFSNVTGLRLELFNSGGNIGASANGNLVITEVMVATDSSINVALGAPVTVIGTTYQNQFASFLTDGNPLNQSHPTDPPGQNNFSFTVDLQGVYALSSLEFQNRTGCCPERLTNYRVEVLSPLMATLWTGDVRTNGTNSGSAGVDTILAGSGAGTFAGQYVRITPLSGQNYNPQISEFRAFGTLVPEPGTAVLGLLAGAGALLRRKR